MVQIATPVPRTLGSQQPTSVVVAVAAFRAKSQGDATTVVVAGKAQSSITFNLCILLRVGAKYLEYELDVVRHGNPVAVGQGEDLVVVEHSIEVFDPDGIHRSVADNPLLLARTELDKLVPCACVSIGGGTSRSTDMFYSYVCMCGMRQTYCPPILIHNLHTLHANLTLI